ncbi:MAG: YhhN family protein [Sediminibacterium sp.]|nr:YhhN family protein [Sediminibacterium sp.]
MEGSLNKKVLTVFWIVLLVHCVFLYLELPYVAVTKPMLTPLLLLYLLMNDRFIGRPMGKFIFYIGMFLAFFGDVLLIVITDTFFLSGMIAFMVMNICYSISFLRLNPMGFRFSFAVIFTMAFLAFSGYSICSFLADELGDYRDPIIIYIFTVSAMITTAVNVAGNPVYQSLAVRTFIPGAFIFLVENTLIALNRFHFNSDKNIYVAVMLTYGIAQYLLVRGIAKAYPSFEPGATSGLTD